MTISAVQRLEPKNLVAGISTQSTIDPIHPDLAPYPLAGHTRLREYRPGNLLVPNGLSPDRAMTLLPLLVRLGI